jgi:putative membrane-bound dehydrogenase-like protein
MAFLIFSLAFFLTIAAKAEEEPKPIKIFFLGDNGHHEPRERFAQLQPVLAKQDIELTYTDQADDLNPKTLAAYDGLIVYANITKISPEQEKALLDFVKNGKGFIPIHCASYCFLNSPKYIDLVGAQFLRHGTGVFRTTITEANHPIMKGFAGFESWDETYVHTKHNTKDRIVLEYRPLTLPSPPGGEGKGEGDKEPWTWVRTQGKGRVFYTAWGHDERTWSNPGFQNLIERGIRWAVGRDPSVVPAFADRPRMTEKRTDVKPFEYVDARVPFYPPSRQWGVTGQPFDKMQKPLDPAESMKHMVTPVDFEVQLFASEPDLGGKPIAMNWDERGRLWVCVTVDYPNNKQPEGQGHDKIVICEDTKGTGRADKFTVFADKLSLPTSLTFWRGGVIVTQPPHTLFLKDTNGDDVADERHVLFTGWHTDDTHAGPSNLRYGLDNWIYGMVGYAGFEGQIGGERHSFRQGFYRFRPDGSKMEFLRNTNNNSWGVGFSEEGILFGSTANGNPSVHLPIPNRYYEAVRGWSSTVLTGIAGNAPIEPITDKVRQVDYHGHFTAGAGHALYTARSYPQQYWNRTAFVAEPTGHLLATFEIQPNGSSFRSRNAWNLLASDDEWTAPIMAEVGPDSQVWVIDWYNYIVQHNPTPPGWKTGKGNAYETELRDKKHGRIYRIVYKGSELPEPISQLPAPISLKDASPEKLVAPLKNPNMFWRLHAQRLLVERGKQDVVSALIELAKDRSVDKIGLNPGVIHALWTLHGLGALDESNAAATAVVGGALEHPSAGVRRNAVQVMPRNSASVKAIEEARLLGDSDAQVRLATLLSLAEIPPCKEAADKLLVVLRDVQGWDVPMLDAATSAAAKHSEYFLTGLSNQFSSIPEPVYPIFERVAEHYARGGPEKSVGQILSSTSRYGGQRAESIIAGLTRGWPKDKPPTADSQIDKSLADLFGKLPPRGQGRLLELATRWHSKALEQHSAEIAASLLTQVQDAKAKDSDRVAAAEQLINLRRQDADSAGKILEQITPQTAPELARGFIEAAGKSDAPEVPKRLLDILPLLTPSARSTSLSAFLSRADWTDALLDALDKGKVAGTDLSLDQKQTLLSHPRQTIADRARRLLAKGGGIPNPDRQKVVDELMPLTERAGDSAAGKIVFKNQCAKCHMHSGEGAHIGPDLTGMAVHPKSHLLVEIMDPSRSVEGNYRQYVVTTTAGRVVPGLLASETRTAVEILDAEGKRHSIQREDIDELHESNKSLMPEGFEKQLSKDDLVNLLEFLTQKGKFLPLPLGKVATVTSVRGMFYSEETPAERLVFDDWSPKTFHGVPFNLIDPLGGRIPNVILLYGPEGRIPPRMPKQVAVPCNAPAKAIHLLSGVSGWGYPLGKKGSISVIVRLHYEDGKTEDHELKNGLHFADYIRRQDVPDSQFAFGLLGRQIRYLAISPQRRDKIKEIEFIKGPDETAPVIMAVTVETP